MYTRANLLRRSDCSNQVFKHTHWPLSLACLLSMHHSRANGQAMIHCLTDKNYYMILLHLMLSLETAAAPEIHKTLMQSYNTQMQKRKFTPPLWGRPRFSASCLLLQLLRSAAVPSSAPAQEVAMLCHWRPYYRTAHCCRSEE